MKRFLALLSVIAVLTLAACLGGSETPPAAARPTPTPTPTPPSGLPAIGYVGCSNSAASVEGYHLDGGDVMWPFIRNYGGGTIHQWAVGTQSSQYWQAFTRQQQLSPATTFWLSLCARVGESNYFNDAEAVVAGIRSRVPNAVIYVSALNDFTETCPICGPNGPELMQQTRDQLVAADDALLGPDLGTLTPSQVTEDHCHPNTPGKMYLGQFLEDFFG